MDTGDYFTTTCQPTRDLPQDKMEGPGGEREELAQKLTRRLYTALFQCFINSWKQNQQTGGDDIPEAQEAREIGLHFVPFLNISFLLNASLAKVD